jgi:hypothetical protein
MAKTKKDATKVVIIRAPKRTSIGSGMPRNRHKRRAWKAYRGQGR